MPVQYLVHCQDTLQTSLELLGEYEDGVDVDVGEEQARDLMNVLVLARLTQVATHFPPSSLQQPEYSNSVIESMYE